MRRKYSDAEKDARIYEKYRKEQAREYAKWEKEQVPDIWSMAFILFVYWSIYAAIKYVLPLFFKLIFNLIKSLLRTTFSFTTSIVKFIYRPLSKKDTLLIFRLIGFFFRLNLIFFTFFIIGAIIFALTLI